MVQGETSAVCLGSLIPLQGSANAKIAKQNLRQHVLPHLRSLSVRLRIFVQDNTPCHSSRKVRNFSLEEKFDPMDC